MAEYVRTPNMLSGKNKISILYLANIRFPTERAHGLQIAESCSAFASLGCQVTLLVPTRKQSEFIIKNPDWMRLYNLKTPFSVKYLKLPDPFCLNLGKWGFLLQSLMFSVYGLWEIWKQKPSLVYSRYYIFTPLLKLTTRPTVMEAHEIYDWPNCIQKLIYNCVDFVICNTKALKGTLNKKGVKTEKLYVEPNGVGQEFFINNNKKTDKTNYGNNINLLYAGHFYVWKGIYTLIDAMQHLSSKYKLTLVGGLAKDTDGVLAYLKDKDWANNIKVKASVEHKKVCKYIKEADILILPNTRDEYSTYYTSPIKLFEYLASGKPIVISDLPSMREIVDKSCVHFFKAEDSKSLALAIEEAAKFESRHIKAKIRINIAKKHTWEKRASRILNIISPNFHE